MKKREDIASDWGAAMTMGELAGFLRLHPNTLRRLVTCGRIPGAFKVGSRWRFNRKAIEEWSSQTRAPRCSEKPKKD